MRATRHLRYIALFFDIVWRTVSSQFWIRMCDYLCFQVKSVVPFSEPFTVDPENPPPEKDYDVYFKTLKDGITGKELLEQTPSPVSV